MASKMADACLEGRARWEELARGGSGVPDKDEEGAPDLHAETAVADFAEASPAQAQPVAPAAPAEGPAN
jgi:hypothetical protein